MLRTGKTDTDGVVVLGGYVHADRDISPLADQVFAGVLSSASVLGRPKDSFGAMFHYIRMSGRLTATRELEAALGRPLTSGNLGPIYGVQSHEEVVELQCTAHVYPGVTVEPDFQYVIRPGATGAVHDAAVLGVRTNVQFQRPAARASAKDRADAPHRGRSWRSEEQGWREACPHCMARRSRRSR